MERGGTAVGVTQPNDRFHIDHDQYIISGQCNPLATLIPP